MVEAKVDIEQMVVNQLKDYKRMVGQIKVLEKYPIGGGMYLTPTNDEDLLQDLHRMLKGMPSYMYLNKREQELETVANAYLTRFPLGTKAQLYEVSQKHGATDEDVERLEDLKRRIRRVIESRSGNMDGYDAVLRRLAKVQELQDQVSMIDGILAEMSEYKPHLSRLLNLHYIEGNTGEETAELMGISRRTFFTWKQKAVAEYTRLAVLH